MQVESKLKVSEVERAHAQKINETQAQQLDIAIQAQAADHQKIRSLLHDKQELNQQLANTTLQFNLRQAEV